MSHNGDISDLMDLVISSGLETDVDTYNDVINRCTYWEGRFIISVFINYREDKFQRAREIFNSYLEKKVDKFI